MNELTTHERFKRGGADAGPFFRYIADFVGFTEEDAAAIHEARFVIEPHIPKIVADFYAHLLRFPATRKHFLHKDGRVDREYLELRMRHQATFWRRAAHGPYDEDFARFVDYVGRTHTSQGADPRIYIEERYVMGMVGFVQRRIAAALAAELGELDPDLERRAVQGWNALLMVLLELLARSYAPSQDHPAVGQARVAELPQTVDEDAILELSLDTYERALGMAPSIEYKEVRVAEEGEIGEGQRKIVDVDGLSVGLFRHKGQWVALHNSCLHRGGPVCTGTVDGDTIFCPWHGYAYDLPTGELLLDRSAALPKYPVEVRAGGVYVRIPILVRDEVDFTLDFGAAVTGAGEDVEIPLGENEFRTGELAPGGVRLVHLGSEPVAVYNVDGTFYATHDRCTHAGGPLSDGTLEGQQIICPWHASCFDVTTGEATCGPATEAVQRYRVVVAGGTARVEPL